MEKEWADPADPVFLLVPRAFKVHADKFYEQIGQPSLTSNNFWDVYTQILALFRFLPDDDPNLSEALKHGDEVVEIELLSGLRDLPHGDNTTGTHGYYYLGGLENPPTADEGDANANEVDLREYAYFTPSEDDDE